MLSSEEVEEYTSTPPFLRAKISTGRRWGRLNEVESIKDSELIKDMEDYLREQSERNALLFLYGIYSGFRISDIIDKRVRDVKGKMDFDMIEKKTGKVRKIPIHPKLKKAIDSYIVDKKDYEFLFKSRKGSNAPITRQQAYRVLRDAGKKFGLRSIGTHTMRKTFGYHLYQQTQDINLVQSVLGHSSPEITKTYIGITRERMYDAIRRLKY